MRSDVFQVSKDLPFGIVDTANVKFDVTGVNSDGASVICEMIPGPFTRANVNLEGSKERNDRINETIDQSKATGQEAN